MSTSRDELPDWLPDDASGVLIAARQRRMIADRAEADLMQLAVHWVIQPPAESIVDAAGHDALGDAGVPVAGESAPWVAEFAIAEFAAAVGMGTDAGRRYLGQAVECRFRLKRVWKRVLAGDLPAWKARRIAEQTMTLTLTAAAYVDRHVAPVAHKIGPAQLDRLIREAVARFMPELAEEERRRGWDQRHATIHYGTAGIAGTCQVTGELDLADAIDLDNALAADARVQADLGSTLTLDQRRSVALGNLARRDLTLDLPTSDQPNQTRKPQRRGGRPRQVVLYVHTSQAAICGVGGAGGSVGRVENTSTPVSVETIRQWCGHPQARVVVKPVIDLAEHIHHSQYEIDGRIAEPVALRDVTCVFPWCTRPARRLKPGEHAADCDHLTPYAQGGATCTCQIAALCRRHHRLKTHGGWHYRILEPGSYLWTSPHAYQYLRDHTGTLDVTGDQHRRRRGDP